MYNDRLKKWNLNGKNIKDREVRAILRKKASRDAAGKTTNIRFHGNSVSFDNVMRHLKRNNISIEEVLDDPTTYAPTPPGLIVRTPSPQVRRSPTLPNHLREPEKLFVNVRCYIKGSFEARQWISRGDDMRCYSTKMGGQDSTPLARFENKCFTACDFFSMQSYSKARQLLRRGMDSIKDLLTAEHPHTLPRLFSIYSTLRKLGRPEIASIITSQISNMAAVILPEENLFRQISALINSSDPSSIDGVISLARRCVGDTFEEVLGGLHSSTLECRLRYTHWENPENSEGHLRSLLQACEERFGPQDQRSWDIVFQLAQTLFTQVRLAESESMALDLLNRISHVEPQTLSLTSWRCNTLELLSLAQHDQGKIEEAVSSLRKAIRMSAEFYGLDDPTTIGWLTQLQSMLTWYGNPAEADEIKQQIAELISGYEDDE